MAPLQKRGKSGHTTNLHPIINAMSQQHESSNPSIYQFFSEQQREEQYQMSLDYNQDPSQQPTGSQPGHPKHTMTPKERKKYLKDKCKWTRSHYIQMVTRIHYDYIEEGKEIDWHELACTIGRTRPQFVKRRYENIMGKIRREIEGMAQAQAEEQWRGLSEGQLTQLICRSGHLEPRRWIYGTRRGGQARGLAEVLNQPTLRPPKRPKASRPQEPTLRPKYNYKPKCRPFSSTQNQLWFGPHAASTPPRTPCHPSQLYILPCSTASKLPPQSLSHRCLPSGLPLLQKLEYGALSMQNTGRLEEQLGRVIEGLVGEINADVGQLIQVDQRIRFLKSYYDQGLNYVDYQKHS